MQLRPTTDPLSLENNHRRYMPDNKHCLQVQWSLSCVIIQTLRSLLNCSLEMSLFPHLNVRTGKASCAYGQGSGSAWPKSWVIQTVSALLVIIHISHISGFESDMSAILITSCQFLWHPGLRTISTAPICIDVPERVISSDSQVQNIVFFPREVLTLFLLM